MATKKKSAETPTAPPAMSVFDFIYHDARRIASFLSQFDTSGLLTQVTRSASVRGSRHDEGSTDGNINVLAAKVAASVTTSSTDEYGKDSQRVYDPMWANARTLLDHLREAGMLKRNVDEAAIGEIVMCTGSLSIFDLQMMRKTWDLKSVRELMTSGINVPTPTKLSSAARKLPHVVAAHDAAVAAAKSAHDGLNLFWDMVTILPHTIQAKLAGDMNVWCSLRPDGMTIDPSDITLKHGTSIPGDWSILGILDARPNATEPPSTPDFGDGVEMAAKMMGIIAPVAKNLLGRPETDYGITPLLVFRKVA